MLTQHLRTKPHSRRTLLASASVAAGATFLTSALPGTHVAARASEATPSPDGDLDATFSQFADFIEAQMSAYGIPGVAVGIIAGDRQFTAAFGVTNVDHPLPVDADTFFQIGSITKTYTGATIMRLVEAGKIDLAAPVRDYLPDFRVADPEVSASVTVGHLLNHTGGWEDRSFQETGDGDDALKLAVQRLADAPQVSPLGKYFSYNNSGYAVAGLVIEAVTGQTYEAAVADLLINPLGTSQSFFLEEIVTRAVAVGHDFAPDDPGGQPVVVGPWALPRSENPAGGLTASLNDQLRYARLFLSNGTEGGTQILSPDSISSMFQPSGPGGSTPFEVIGQMGVSWPLEDRAGTQVVFHLAGTTGQMSNLVMVPGARFAMAILTNANSGAKLGVEAGNWALEHVLGLPQPERTAVFLTPEQRAEYVGDYEMPSGAGTIRVSDQDDGLRLNLMQPGGGLMVDSPLEFFEGDLATFQYTRLPVFTDFIREAGDVAWIRFVGRTYPKTQVTP